MVNLNEILKTFHSLGCYDEALCYAAYRVYVHLTEEKRLHQVQYHYEEKLRLIYLTAKREANDHAPIELVIPVPATGELDLSRIQHYRDVIELPEGHPKADSIVLAICDPSSTVLLYKMTPGLKNITEKLPSKGKLLRQRTACDAGK